MPIYEYDCPSCGVIEVVQGITEKPLTRCPNCGKRKVKKLISESSFHLKGSGWYKTDYASGNGGNGGNGGSGGNGKHKSGDASESAPKSDTAAKDTSAKETAKDTGGSSGKDSASKKAAAAT